MSLPLPFSVGDLMQAVRKGDPAPSQDLSSNPSAPIYHCDSAWVPSSLVSVCLFSWLHAKLKQQTVRREWCFVGQSTAEQTGGVAVILWGLDDTHRVSKDFLDFVSFSRRSVTSEWPSKEKIMIKL